MEDKKNNVISMNPQAEGAGKPTYEQLQEQLMKSQQIIMMLRKEAQQKLESINYSNAFQQQQFMLDIVKMRDYFPLQMVENAIKTINDFWFEEPKEVKNEEKQG